MSGSCRPPGIAGAAVVFGVDGLGEDDRAFVAKLLDQDVIARRKIDVVGGVAAAGRAHVLGVERVLEREHDAVHRHLVESGSRPNCGVEFGCALERVGVMPEISQTGGAPGGSGPSEGMAVEIAATGDGPLAADIEGAERVDLAGIGLADDHAELLLHGWIGGGRFHAAEFQRRALIGFEFGQHGRGFHGLVGKRTLRLRAVFDSEASASARRLR